MPVDDRLLGRGRTPVDDPAPAPGLISWLRAHPVTRATKKVVIALIGAAIVALGLLLVPLPGPGWLIVLAGLGVWAIEFVWARQLLKFARAQLQRWLVWVGMRPIWQRWLLGLAGLILLVGLAWLALWMGVGKQGIANFWDYITTH
jgi:uncharacterized protein (TIGR02611 family)